MANQMSKNTLRRMHPLGLGWEFIKEKKKTRTKTRKSCMSACLRACFLARVLFCVDAFLYECVFSCVFACFRACLRGRVRVFFFSFINSQPSIFKLRLCEQSHFYKFWSDFILTGQ